MIAPLSLANLITVIFAALCLWTIANQSRGAVVKAWRLAVPPCFAAVVALVLLAGVFEATLAHDAEWLVAAAIGALLGRTERLGDEVEVDRRRDLVRQHRSADGPLVAIALLLLSLADLVARGARRAADRAGLDRRGRRLLRRLARRPRRLPSPSASTRLPHVELLQRVIGTSAASA